MSEERIIRRTVTTVHEEFATTAQPASSLKGADAPTPPAAVPLGGIDTRPASAALAELAPSSAPLAEVAPLAPPCDGPDCPVDLGDARSARDGCDPCGDPNALGRMPASPRERPKR